MRNLTDHYLTARQRERIAFGELVGELLAVAVFVAAIGGAIYLPSLIVWLVERF